MSRRTAQTLRCIWRRELLGKNTDFEPLLRSIATHRLAASPDPEPHLLLSLILIPRCGAVPVHPSAARSALQDKHMSLRLTWDRPKSRGIGRTQHVVPSKNIYDYEHQGATTRAVYTLDRGRRLT